MLSLSIYFFSLLILTLTASSTASNSSFSFTNFNKNPTFNSSFTLYGEAKLANASVELTSNGRVMFDKPIKLSEGKPKKSVSFETHFSFSMSKQDGGSLVFFVVPTSLNLSLFGDNSTKPKVVGVQLKYDYVFGEVHIGIHVGSFVSARVNNASGIRLNVSNGDIAKAWIDYEAGSKRIEVRLSHLGGSKQAEALLWYAIDLLKLWGDEKVFVGLAAQNRNSSQSYSIYSWSFEQRHVPDWMHSQPLDPDTDSKRVKKPVAVENRKDCVLRAVAAMILGVACGALASYVVLCLWRIFGNRRPVVPEEFAMQAKVFDPVVPEEFAMQAKVFEYEKMEVVVVDKSIEDGKQ